MLPRRKRRAVRPVFSTRYLYGTSFITPVQNAEVTSLLFMSGPEIERDIGGSRLVWENYK
jgi:hypothetical protein